MIQIKDGFQGERSLLLPKMIVDQMEKIPLLSILHITYIGYYPKAKFHYREREQTIDQYILIYCVEGKGWYKVRDEVFFVSANQYFILPKGESHVYAADEKEPWTIYWIHFKGTLADQYIPDNIQPQTIQPKHNSRISDRISLFEEIFNTVRNGFSIPNLIYTSSLFHHFLGSLSCIDLFRKSSNNVSCNVNIIEETIHYMKENIEKHLSAKDFEDYTGYSSKYLSALFKEQTGNSLIIYFNLLKIQKACELFDTTDIKVNQICHKLGFDDCFYFSRLFKKIMGISPKEYKERVQE